MRLINQISKCNNCLKCLAACPLPEARQLDMNEINLMLLGLTEIEKIRQFSEICLSCGICSEVCPSRCDRALLFSSLKNCHNNQFLKNRALGGIFPVLRRELNYWKTRTKLPTIWKNLDQKNSEYHQIIFYVGCYFLNNPEEIQWTLEILDWLNVDYGILAGLDSCCGRAHQKSGDILQADLRFEKFKNIIASLNTTAIYTGCRHCNEALSKAGMFIEHDLSTGDILPFIIAQIQKKIPPSREYENWLLINPSPQIADFLAGKPVNLQLDFNFTTLNPLQEINRLLDLDQKDYFTDCSGVIICDSFYSNQLKKSLKDHPLKVITAIQALNHLIFNRKM